MFQAVSRRPLTPEALDRFQASACEICGVDSGYSPNTSVLPRPYHSTCTSYSQFIHLPPMQYHLCN